MPRAVFLNNTKWITSNWCSVMTPYCSPGGTLDWWWKTHWYLTLNHPRKKRCRRYFSCTVTGVLQDESPSGCSTPRYVHTCALLTRDFLQQHPWVHFCTLDLRAYCRVEEDRPPVPSQPWKSSAKTEAEGNECTHREMPSQRTPVTVQGK